MENIIIGVITLLATLIGAWVGSKYSYRGAMDAVSKQIQYQKDLLIAEEVKNNERAARIVTKLLWTEIEYNCRTFDNVNKSFSTVYFLKDKVSQYSYGNFIFIFDDYNTVKFELLKYNSKIVQDVIEIYYKMFSLNTHKDLNELNQEEFDRVKTLYELKDKIKSFVETNI